MKDLINREKVKLGDRIKTLRELLSLTQSQLAKAVGFSKGTLVAMESGKRFTGEYLLAVAYFFAMDLHEFSKYEESLPNEMELRNKIKKFHQKHKSTAYKILEGPPTLTAVLDYRLLKTDFFNTWRTVNDVVEHIKSEYELPFGSSIVSQRLKNMVEIGSLKRKQSSGRNYLYQASKKIN